MFKASPRYKQTWQSCARKRELLALLQRAWPHSTNHYVTLKVIKRCWSSRQPSRTGRTTQDGKHHRQRWWCSLQERKRRGTHRRAYKRIGHFSGWIPGDIQLRVREVREETVTIWICSWTKRNVLAALHVNGISSWYQNRLITRK